MRIVCERVRFFVSPWVKACASFSLVRPASLSSSSIPGPFAIGPPARLICPLSLYSPPRSILSILNSFFCAPRHCARQPRCGGNKSALRADSARPGRATGHKKDWSPYRPTWRRLPKRPAAANPPPLLLPSCLIGRDIRTLCKRGREQKKNNNGGGETRAGLYKFPFRRETRAIAKSSSIEEPRGGVGRRGRLKRAKSRFPRGISHFLRGARSCLFSLSPSLAICLFGKLLGALELCMRSFLCAREHAAPPCRLLSFSLSLSFSLIKKNEKITGRSCPRECSARSSAASRVCVYFRCIFSFYVPIYMSLWNVL